jgi:hypothetical protein
VWRFQKRIVTPGLPKNPIENPIASAWKFIAIVTSVQRYMGHATSYMTPRYRRRAKRTRNSQAIVKVLGGAPQSVTQSVEKVVEA